MEYDFKSVNLAFSNQSPVFDDEDQANPILGWMRNKVRTHVLGRLTKGDRILELNAGTGLDACFFAANGYNVCATDLSDGMVEQMRLKVKKYHLEEMLVVKQCSYTNLNRLEEEGKFNYIFSNFGGLNCIADLTEVTRYIPNLLKPGGYATFVIMPPVCPWEMLTVVKGNKEAFRRFRKKGSMAHLEGQYFLTYYFTPSQVLKAFGSNFTKVKLEGLGCFSPPPYAQKFATKLPRTYKFLTGIDDKLSGYYPFNSWADHFIITVQYTPK